MFQRSLQELSNSIHAAMRCQDPVVFRLARERLDRALDLGDALPGVQARRWQQRIDAMLPGDWVLWMATLDVDAEAAAATLH